MKGIFYPSGRCEAKRIHCTPLCCCMYFVLMANPTTGLFKHGDETSGTIKDAEILY
jgi:hypothetical protein